MKGNGGVPGRNTVFEPTPFPFTGDGCCATLGLVGVLPYPILLIKFLYSLFVITNIFFRFAVSNYKHTMISKRFGRKPKGKDNTGRSTKVTSIMISQDLKDRLSELKDAYECCYNETVTYDQMLERWADNVGRFDPKVLGCLETIRGEREKAQERMAAGLGITAEQLKRNKDAFDPTDPENMPWKLSYFFEKDGEQIEALPGVYTPFYANINGQNIGMSKLLADGWSLQNEIGIELDLSKAQKICTLIKEHQTTNQ